MSRRMAAVLPETPITDLVRQMLEKHLNGAAVVNEKNRLIGAISDTDVISLEVGETAGKTAADIMNPPSATVTQDVRIQELGKILASAKANLLFVVDGDGQPLGTVAGSDVLKALEDIRQE